MNQLTSRRTGYMLLLLGIVTALGFIFLLIFYAAYLNTIPSLYFFGPLDDLFTVLQSLLLAVLAVMLLSAYERELLWVHIPLAALTVLGALIVTVDSLVMGGFMSSITEAYLGVNYGLSFITEHDLQFGFGLIGIWLTVLIYHAYQNNAWNKNLIVFGFVTSTLMISGLLGSIGSLGSGILFPIWAILLGRSILSRNTPAL